MSCVVKEVKGPIVYNVIGISPVIPLPTLKEIGVSLVSLGNAQWAAAKAIWDCAHDLKMRSGGPTGVQP
jgi:2-methylisocitrate lyase-like PEP mutase family enzyme